MHHSKSDIFWKCWLWAAIFGSILAGFYAFVSNVGPRWLSGGDFFAIMIIFGIIGSYFGAGLVGWRIADKYFHAYEQTFRKRYITYSIITLVLLIAVSYSPLSILGLLWSFVAPFCVLQALREKLK